MIAYVNNSFIDESKAVLQVSDLALQRGYAAFDFLRTKNGIPLFIDDYLARLYNSAAMLYLQPKQTKKELKEIIYELIKRNKQPQSGIRLIFTGGYSTDSYEPAVPNLVVLQQSIQLPSSQKFSTGLNVITHEYKRDLPTIKSINYLMGIWLQQKVKEQNAADVLYHKDGWVSEFPRANIFIVTKEGKIVTPAEGILKGITRMKLLELMKDKFIVEERALHLDEVKVAAEVFMTSTTKRILPICKVDALVIGKGKTGPITTLLYNMFLELEEQKAVVDNVV